MPYASSLCEHYVREGRRVNAIVRTEGGLDAANPGQRGQRAGDWALTPTRRHRSVRPENTRSLGERLLESPDRRPHVSRRHPARTTADQLVTRSTYRQLLMKGLAPDEAANLTAFLCGIPVADVRWSLRQINQLLFLRELARNGRFGSADGEAPRPH